MRWERENTTTEGTEDTEDNLGDALIDRLKQSWARSTLCYDRKRMTNWCVYVPEGKMEFRDVVTSVPLVRCSWAGDAKAKRVLPLLSVDTLRTAPAR